MPLAVFITNVKASSFNMKFVTELSEIVAGKLHREEEAISVHIQPDQFIVRAGTTEPAGYIKLYTSRDYGDIEHRRQTSQAILDFIVDKLKLPDAKRFMVYMYKLSGDNIGLDGGLVSDRYGCMAEGGPFDVRYCKSKINHHN